MAAPLKKAVRTKKTIASLSDLVSMVSPSFRLETAIFDPRVSMNPFGKSVCPARGLGVGDGSPHGKVYKKVLMKSYQVRGMPINAISVLIHKHVFTDSYI